MQLRCSYSPDCELEVLDATAKKQQQKQRFVTCSANRENQVQISKMIIVKKKKGEAIIGIQTKYSDPEKTKTFV